MLSSEPILDTQVKIKNSRLKDERKKSIFQRIKDSILQTY
jgi:hypothetical protein